MRPGSAAGAGAGALGSAAAGSGALGSAGAGGGALGSAGAGGGAFGSAGAGGGAFGSPGGPCMKVLPEGGGGPGVGVGSGSAWATDGSARATTAAPANAAIVNDFARRLRCSEMASGSCMQTKLQCCCRDASVGRSQSG